MPRNRKQSSLYVAPDSEAERDQWDRINHNRNYFFKYGKLPKSLSRYRDEPPFINPSRSSHFDAPGRRRRRRCSSASCEYSDSSTDDPRRYFRRPSVRPLVQAPLPYHPHRRSSKKKLYFIRPHDGRPEHRRGTLGRLKDALTGQGPDIFVTATTLGRRMRDRPQRWQWAGYGIDSKEIRTKVVEPGFAWSELDPVKEAPWARRSPMEGYDFRKRRYGGPREDALTDARWSPGARRDTAPWMIRDRHFKRRWALV